MDNETIGNIIGLSATATLFAAFVGAVVSANRTNRRGRKSALILDREYGPKIKSNLDALEDAVKAGDRDRAFVMLGERNMLIKELMTVAPGYITTSWTGFTYASDEVKKDVAKGAGLESYLKA